MNRRKDDFVESHPYKKLATNDSWSPTMNLNEYLLFPQVAPLATVPVAELSSVRGIYAAAIVYVKRRCCHH